jgi:tetratricopeptide (TPR) repeat protein
VAARLPVLNKTYRFVSVISPHYELPKNNIETGWRSGRVRQQLSNTETPIDLRMKALLALQHMPARHSASILRDTLSDSSDDLRLLAYGMLDNREKQLTHRIQDALQRYEKLPTAEERYIPTRELAELYWELVYQNLVQGDMRQFSLEQVQRFSNEALRFKVKDAGLWAISGRMWTLRGDYIRAMGGFTTAIKQGFPLVRAEPYLAELAYLRGDYATTRRLMAGLREDGRSRPLRMAADYWGQ